MRFCFLLWKELKKAKIKEEGKKKRNVDTAAEKKKREKKVYDLPGQRRDPPDEVLFCRLYLLT